MYSFVVNREGERGSEMQHIEFSAGGKILESNSLNGMVETRLKIQEGMVTVVVLNRGRIGDSLE